MQYLPVMLFWSKSKQPEIIKRILMDYLQPMTLKECQVFISKQMDYPHRTFTVQQVSEK